MKKFTVKPNFGFWKVVSEKYSVCFFTKANAEVAAHLLNNITDPITLHYTIERYNGVKFKQGDLIIWDSGFGYELGRFIGVGQVFEHYYQVNLTTSRFGGIASFPESEIHPYTEELLNLLSKKYGYKKSYSLTF